MCLIRRAVVRTQMGKQVQRPGGACRAGRKPSRLGQCLQIALPVPPNLNTKRLDFQAKRELREESGISMSDLSFGGCVNIDVGDESKGIMVRSLSLTCSQFFVTLLVRSFLCSQVN
jgi:hypothetical protein